MLYLNFCLVREIIKLYCTITELQNYIKCVNTLKNAEKLDVKYEIKKYYICVKKNGLRNYVIYTWQRARSQLFFSVQY